MLPLLTTTVEDGIHFAYRDTGSPEVSGQVSGNATTLVMVHGHTCHSGVFTKLCSLASSQAENLRIISLNRRCYPGSTSHTDEELRILTSGTFDERSGMFDREGEYLLMFVDIMIREHGLEKIIIAGWSLGAAYMNMLISAIDSKRLGGELKDRLRRCIRGFMYLDAPSNALGIALPTGTSIPIDDETLSPAEQGKAYGELLSRYFPHPDLASRDFHKLITQLNRAIKTPTFTHTPPEEFLSMADPTAGFKGDNCFNDIHLKSSLNDRTKRALLGHDVRGMWANSKFWCVYGEETAWNVIWTAWCLEDMISEAKDGDGDERLTLGFKPVKGANHFMIYDNPELLLEVIQSCIEDSE